VIVDKNPMPPPNSSRIVKPRRLPKNYKVKQEPIERRSVPKPAAIGIDTKVVNYSNFWHHPHHMPFLVHEKSANLTPTKPRAIDLKREIAKEQIKAWCPGRCIKSCLPENDWQTSSTFHLEDVIDRNMSKYPLITSRKQVQFLRHFISLSRGHGKHLDHPDS